MSLKFTHAHLRVGLLFANTNKHTTLQTAKMFSFVFVKPQWRY